MKRRTLPLACRAAALLVCCTPVALVAQDAPAAPAPPAEKTVAEIQTAIATGVDRLIALQRPDGSWATPDLPGGDVYPVGRTALATLALMHSFKHLHGDLAEKADKAIKSGLAYIVQQAPESKTYTSGLVEQVLYKAGADKYRVPIGKYAWIQANSQMQFGPMAGAYSYDLMPWPGDAGVAKGAGPPAALVTGRADNSNTQFAVLALYFAEKSGFQVPKIVWARLQKYYMGAQHQDGGWDYQSEAWRKEHVETDPWAKDERLSMTVASTISLYLVNEMIYATKHDQCKPQPSSEPVEKGLAWISTHFPDSEVPYTWYACERLGILSGYSEFGGHDWFQEGARDLIPRVADGRDGGWGGMGPTYAFEVLFLSRGLEPVIFNKLKRQGEWDLHLHDLQHVTEFITDKYQYGVQWRIVTLNASVDFLLKVPMLWISGHDKLAFTPEEKAKLKQYVERGGTIVGEACCSRKEFDDTFRALCAELWPDVKLQPLPQNHALYTTPKPLTALKPQVLALAPAANQGRLGVLYFPNGISCHWERGGNAAGPAYAVASNLYHYVVKYVNKDKSPIELERERGVKPPPAPEPKPAEEKPADAPPADGEKK